MHGAHYAANCLEFWIRRTLGDFNETLTGESRSHCSQHLQRVWFLLSWFCIVASLMEVYSVINSSLFLHIPRESCRQKAVCSVSSTDHMTICSSGPCACLITRMTLPFRKKNSEHFERMWRIKVKDQCLSRDHSCLCAVFSSAHVFCLSREKRSLQMARPWNDCVSAAKWADVRYYVNDHRP